MNAESSTTSTRNFLLVVGGIVFLCDRYDRLRGLRSDELLDRGDELIFLHRLGQKCGGTFFDGAIAMFCACARSDDHHGDAAGGRALAAPDHEVLCRPAGE